MDERQTDERLLPDYHARDTAAGDARRIEKNEARSRWRRTHVELDTATRRAADQSDVDVAIEAQDAHLRAFLDWKAGEASFIAARLGFTSAPVPSRRARRGG